MIFIDYISSRLIIPKLTATFPFVSLTTPVYLAALSGGGEAGRLPCEARAGSMMRLGVKAGSAGTWDLRSAGRERRRAKNGNPSPEKGRLDGIKKVNLKVRLVIGV